MSAQLVVGELHTYFTFAQYTLKFTNFAMRKTMDPQLIEELIPQLRIKIHLYVSDILLRHIFNRSWQMNLVTIGQECLAIHAQADTTTTTSCSRVRNTPS